MDDFLTDQQQADVVKSWLRENGLWLVAGVVLGLGGLFGWNQWQRYQERRAIDASMVYETVLKAVREQRLEDAEAGMKQLAEAYARTPYVDQGRLVMARLYVDRSNPTEAVNYLQQVVQGSGSTEITHIARLRLARLLITVEKYDDALKALDVPGLKAFAPAFHEIRGDVYFAMGKKEEARSEYEQALNGLVTPVINREVVRAKLDDLGGAIAVAAPPAVAGLPSSSGAAAAAGNTPPGPVPGAP